MFTIKLPIESHDFKMALQDLALAWPRATYCGLLGPFDGLVWPFHGPVCPLYGLLWQNINLIGLELSFLAVIDPNSFGLVLLSRNG